MNNQFNMTPQGMSPIGMINPTPKHRVDIRKVNAHDAMLNPLIEEHKHAPAQVSLFG